MDERHRHRRAATHNRHAQEREREIGRQSKYQVIAAGSRCLTLVLSGGGRSAEDECKGEHDQENQERVERVYCLEGKDVKVTCLMGSSSTFPLKPGEYVQIEKENNDCNFNGPYEITGSALERFITELKEIAETAGWLP